MLWSAAGKPIVEIENPFPKDVKETDFFYNAVLWAYSEGITSGVGNGAFGSALVVNRAQAVTFLYNFLDKPEFNAGGVGFSDVDPNAYYAIPVMWANENGITKGMGDGTFGVAELCIRAHAVTFLYKALVK